LSDHMFAELLEVKQKSQDALKEFTSEIERKSNIKDVCALLDMKSSKHFNLI
jgi:hypothetical protein